MSLNWKVGVEIGSLYNEDWMADGGKKNEDDRMPMEKSDWKVGVEIGSLYNEDWMADGGKKNEDDRMPMEKSE